jgi:hypothetical protein
MLEDALAGERAHQAKRRARVGLDALGNFLGRPSPGSKFVGDVELGCHVKHLDSPTAEAQIDQRDISWRQALVEVLTCGVGRLYAADKPNGWRLDTFVGHGYRRVSQPILSRRRSVLSTVRCALLLGDFSPFCS